ncbi:hypothetical protein TELCIR_22403, partial [Teladorsagia circumcincta]
ASPRPDSVFGGSDSLTAAAAFREDGITTVVFRKKLQAEDEFDHSIQGPMTVIWAKGADPDYYQHTTGAFRNSANLLNNLYNQKKGAYLYKLMIKE